MLFLFGAADDTGAAEDRPTTNTTFFLTNLLGTAITFKVLGVRSVSLLFESNGGLGTKWLSRLRNDHFGIPARSFRMPRRLAQLPKLAS